MKEFLPDTITGNIMQVAEYKKLLTSDKIFYQLCFTRFLIPIFQFSFLSNLFATRLTSDIFPKSSKFVTKSKVCLVDFSAGAESNKLQRSKDKAEIKLERSRRRKRSLLFHILELRTFDDL